ncbi:hypothetical protein Tco_0814677 [Tanacetum coccineum]
MSSPTEHPRHYRCPLTTSSLITPLPPPQRPPRSHLSRTPSQPPRHLPTDELHLTTISICYPFFGPTSGRVAKKHHPPSSQPTHHHHHLLTTAITSPPPSPSSPQPRGSAIDTPSSPSQPLPPRQPRHHHHLITLSPDLGFYSWYQSLVALDLGLISLSYFMDSAGGRVITAAGGCSYKENSRFGSSYDDKSWFGKGYIYRNYILPIFLVGLNLSTCIHHVSADCWSWFHGSSSGFLLRLFQLVGLYALGLDMMSCIVVLEIQSLDIILVWKQLRALYTILGGSDTIQLCYDHLQNSTDQKLIEWFLVDPSELTETIGHCM